MRLPDPPLVKASPVAVQRLAVETLPGQLSRGVRFVFGTLKLAFRFPVLLGPLLLAALLQIGVWIGVLWIIFTHDIREHTTMEALLTLCAMYLTTLLQTLSRALVAYMSASYVRGLPLSLGRALTQALDGMQPLLGLAAIGSLLRFMARYTQITPFMGGGSGNMLRAWDTGSFLVVPVVVLEERTLSESLDRAKALTSDKVKMGTVGVSSATGLITMILLGPWTVFLVLAYHNGLLPYEIMQWLLGGAVLWALSNVVSALANAFFSTCVYLVAREIEREPEAPEVRVPDLLADVLPPFTPEEPEVEA